MIKILFILATMMFFNFLKPIFSIGNYVNNIYTKYIINIIIYTTLFLLLFNILLFIIDIYSNYYAIDFYSNVLPSGEPNHTVPMDPARWWPSGVLQSWTIVGTAIATYGLLSKVPVVSPRSRLLGALASAGVTATQITSHSALNNFVGFNRLMWGFSEYIKNGSWPSLEKVTPKEVESFVAEAIKHVDASKVSKMVKEVTANSNSFLPSSNFDFSDLVDKLIESIFKQVMQVLQPAPVQGFFDDLIGQRMFIEVILFIMCISIFLLFFVFLCNLVFLFNKDKIIKKFDNKFITFYVSYQAFFSWISLFFIPILMFTGLFSLSHGLHWLITNQIPYESLDVDLHKFISSSLVLPLTLGSYKLKKYNNKYNKYKKYKFTPRFNLFVATPVNIRWYSESSIKNFSISNKPLFNLKDLFLSLFFVNLIP